LSYKDPIIAYTTAPYAYGILLAIVMETPMIFVMQGGEGSKGHGAVEGKESESTIRRIKKRI